MIVRMGAIERLGALLTRYLQSGYLKFSVMMTLGFLVLSFAYPFIMKAGARLGELDLAPSNFRGRHRCAPDARSTSGHDG